LEVFSDLKLKKKYKYIVYKLNDDNSQIVVEKLAEEGNYDDFIKAMPKGECRYAIFDFEFEKPGEGLRHKICFFAWSAYSLYKVVLCLGLQIVPRSSQRCCMLPARMLCVRSWLVLLQRSSALI
jgi:hypothetical protein